MLTRCSMLALFGVLLSLGGWSSAKPAPAAAEEPFHKDLLKVAAEYQKWGRVDDEMRWSPELCRQPNPGRAYLSASKDEDTHGKKLYSLLTSNRIDYLKLSKEKSVPVGFAIVKQSWIPEEITDPKLIPKQPIDRTRVIQAPGPIVAPKSDPYAIFGDHFYPYIFKEGKCFKATKQADLFIMMKFDPKTPNTDEGWVYGTVSSDGKTVTAAGRIASCIKCHQDAPHDRLFGLVK